MFRVVPRSVLLSEMDGTARDWGMVTAPVEAIVKAWRLTDWPLPLAMAKFPTPTPLTACPIFQASPAEDSELFAFLKKVMLLSEPFVEGNTRIWS